MIRKIMLSMALLCLCTLTARAAEINPFALVINGVPNSPADEINYLNTAIRVLQLRGLRRHLAHRLGRGERRRYGDAAGITGSR